jgi:hypothetical protein
MEAASSSSSEKSSTRAQKREPRQTAAHYGWRRAGEMQSGATPAADAASPRASPLSPEREERATVIFLVLQDCR